MTLAEAEQKKAAQEASAAATDPIKKKQAEATMTAATNKMKAVITAANPTDTVEILISQPIRVSVKAVAPTTAAK